jgi:hypothetical protein
MFWVMCFRGGEFDSGLRIQNIIQAMSQAESAVFVYLRKEGQHSLISEQVLGFNQPPKPKKNGPQRTTVLAPKFCAALVWVTSTWWLERCPIALVLKVLDCKSWTWSIYPAPVL